MFHSKKWIAGLGLAFSSFTFADITVPMNFTAEKGIGKPAGTVIISKTAKGLLFSPDLHGLTPGQHGFHIHETPSCDKPSSR